MAYYNLVNYYQTPMLITSYEDYSSLDKLYGTNATYDEVLDQIEKDNDDDSTAEDEPFDSGYDF